jgi:hypothetical protein
MLGKLWGRSKATSTHVDDGPRFEKADWKRGNLRTLYLLACVLMIASATTGYDGFVQLRPQTTEANPRPLTHRFMYGLSQQFDTWQVYFDNPRDDANRLGLMNNMFNIGSITSMLVLCALPPVLGLFELLLIACPSQPLHCRSVWPKDQHRRRMRHHGGRLSDHGSGEGLAE